MASKSVLPPPAEVGAGLLDVGLPVVGLDDVFGVLVVDMASTVPLFIAGCAVPLIVEAHPATKIAATAATAAMAATARRPV
ncbi:hypothetical protein ACLMAJ_26430 [Nocardia sp. KC 131]